MQASASTCFCSLLTYVPSNWVCTGTIVGYVLCPLYFTGNNTSAASPIIRSKNLKHGVALPGCKCKEVCRDIHQPNKCMSCPCRIQPATTCQPPPPPRGSERHSSLPGCPSLSFLGKVRIPTEPCLSAPCLTHSQAMVMWHRGCSPECLTFHLCGPRFNTVCAQRLAGQKGCDIYKSQVQPFQVTPVWVHFNTSSASECPHIYR